jgi:hypothetical protein
MKQHGEFSRLYMNVFFHLHEILGPTVIEIRPVVSLGAGGRIGRLMGKGHKEAFWGD